MQEIVPYIHILWLLLHVAFYFFQVALLMFTCTAVMGSKTYLHNVAEAGQKEISQLFVFCPETHNHTLSTPNDPVYF